ncbi:hypothetical protein [Pyxidicoccus caerfyrddinensis]|uniref:hypothetical protein n=1 Tax=Pyxidicoccus caerfyrddinensis TaxID=2709663 RepID=UPI0013D9BCAD|nr:hypothetical protein [Pyxidicoccus caerfyrddinensis]
MSTTNRKSVDISVALRQLLENAKGPVILPFTHEGMPPGSAAALGMDLLLGGFALFAAVMGLVIFCPGRGAGEAGARHEGPHVLDAEVLERRFRGGVAATLDALVPEVGRFFPVRPGVPRSRDAVLDIEASEPPSPD